jgi:hypothetical protein
MVQGFRRRLYRWPKTARIAVGLALVVGGLLGFLPILGFWMLPLGLVVLSVDVPVVRRHRRKLEIWWGRRRARRRRPD